MDEGNGTSVGGDFGSAAEGASPLPTDIAFDTCKEARDAALKWLAKGRKKPFPSMSPMDEMKWFQPPKWSTKSVGTTVPISVCDSNPQRVVLSIQCNGSLRLCTDIKHLREGGGFSLVAGSMCDLELEQKKHAILAQSEWWALSGSGNVSVEVLELLLKDWPTPDDKLPRNRLSANGEY